MSYFLWKQKWSIKWPRGNGFMGSGGGGYNIVSTFLLLSTTSEIPNPSLPTLKQTLQKPPIPIKIHGNKKVFMPSASLL
jgi:hypothetical protein